MNLYTTKPSVGFGQLLQTTIFVRLCIISIFYGYLTTTCMGHEGLHPQYCFAHRVNSIEGIGHALQTGANIECDIIWSQSRNAWVVQHDTPNQSHAGPTVDAWMANLKSHLATGRYNSSFAALWLDIKSPNDDNLYRVLQCVHSTLPSSLNVIYDLNAKDNVLGNKNGYQSIKNRLRDNEGVGIWLKKGEGNSVPALIAKLKVDGITRATVSHGHSLNIDEDTLKTINNLNQTNDAHCFKKVFTWTNSLQRSMEDYINPSNPYHTDGQIIGAFTREWKSGDSGDVEDFRNATKTYSNTQRMATRSDQFWIPTKRPKSYRVVVKTGTKSGAGTDSNIFIKIHGTRGQTPEIRLNGYISNDAFENGSRDIVNLKLADIGTVNQVTIRSDNKYSGAGWYLDSVEVNGKTADFNQWIESGKLTASASAN